MLALGAALAGFAGCGPAVGLDGGLTGVTAGGQQDLAEARSQIQSGYLPRTESITVEGFMSEHDIPLGVPEDAPEIYATLAAAWRKGATMPAPGVDLFLRLGSTIELDDFDRPALNLVVAVDRSGSMDWEASNSDGRSRISAVRQAMRSLFGQLTASDRLALVSFNDRVRIDVSSRAVADVAEFERQVDRWRPEGDTNLYEALRVAFEEAARVADPSRESRVIVFTDALPTVGFQASADILPLVRRYADQGIGFTMMGIGSNFGTELANDIASVPLGNAFFLENAERIENVFTDEFRFFVAPAAVDLTLDIGLVEGVVVRDVYGVPDYVPTLNGARISIPTLFFSNRQGGGVIVVRLSSATTPDFSEAITYGAAELTYTLRNGRQRFQAADLTLPAGLDPTAAEPWYSDAAAQRAALLLDTVLVMREATRLARINRSTAAADLLNEFLGTFDERSAGLADRTSATSRGLRSERELLEALLGTVTPSGYVYNAE